MTVRLSSNLRRFLAGSGSLKQALTNAEIRVYTGAQPASADAAPTGSLLVTYTAAAAARVAEAQAIGTVTLAGAAGSVNTLTIGGVAAIAAAVPFTTDLATTAGLLATAINEFQSSEEFFAVAAGAVVSIYALPGTGATPNAKAIATTVTTMTATPANFAGGTAGSNGLTWGAASTAGVLPRLATQTASGVGVAGGNGGWFRIVSGAADPNTASPAHPFVFRVDGSIGVGAGNGDMTLEGSSYFGADATHTIATFTASILNPS